MINKSCKECSADDFLVEGIGIVKAEEILKYSCEFRIKIYCMLMDYFRGMAVKEGRKLFAFRLPLI